MTSNSIYSDAMNPDRKSLRALAALVRCAVILPLLTLLACASELGPKDRAVRNHAFDPASADQVSFDLEFPPLINELTFVVDGAALNAISYLAQGPGPHPTVVLLHGFPGNERNLDLAQAIRRAGWNVVFFHYRGAWGSGGEFSFLHVIEDVAAVVAAISEPKFAGDHRIDPDRIALVGHSMGGFAALIAGVEVPSVACIVSLSGANLGGVARLLAEDPDQRAGFAASLDSWSGPIKGPHGVVLIQEIVDHSDRFDATARVDELARKPLLLVAGRRDVVTPAALHHDPLVDALRAVDAALFESFVFAEADHAYSGQRIALARRVTNWLEGPCLRAD
ncbi:MAG: alpha/beta fold hydrolase [Myxococcota bacterium]